MRSISTISTRSEEKTAVLQPNTRERSTSTKSTNTPLPPETTSLPSQDGVLLEASTTILTIMRLPALLLPHSLLILSPTSTSSLKVLVTISQNAQATSSIDTQVIDPLSSMFLILNSQNPTSTKECRNRLLNHTMCPRSLKAPSPRRINCELKLERFPRSRSKAIPSLN